MKIICIISVFIFTCGCAVFRTINENNYHYFKNPPNGIKIFENFFCDKTEICNIDWSEYEHWTKRIYGLNSVEHIAMLPDTLVWREAYPCLSTFNGKYGNGKQISEQFPVVGITQEQVIAYSKWRSDRVFEMYLITIKKLMPDSTQNRNKHFTIENYFNGLTSAGQPDPKIKYFPNYRLPTIVERNKILNYSDSIDMAYLKKCNSQYCKDCLAYFPVFHSEISPCVNDSIKVQPLLLNYQNYESHKTKSIQKLRGNVSEWAAENGITFGGSWNDLRDTILKKDIFYYSKPNAFIGARNVCEWKKWKE
jgi:hypothetical protein